MCRVAGRRCPRHDEHRRLIESARQRLSRYSRLAAAATTSEDAERNGQLFQAALGDLESRVGTSSSGPVPTPTPTRAGEYTWAKTAGWSDEDLERALSTSWDDQQAVAAIEKLFDAREAVRGAVAVSAPPDRAVDVWAELEKQPHDLIERPGLRRPTRLTAEQQARADYETMKEVAYLQAEYECAGQLLKAKYRNSGVDARSLWVGPVNRAVKFASPELSSLTGKSTAARAGEPSGSRRSTAPPTATSTNEHAKGRPSMTRPDDRDPLTIQEKLDAQAAGRAAALTGMHPGTNPHRRSDVLDQDPDRIAKLQLMWVRGYQQARAEIEAARPAPTSPDG